MEAIKIINISKKYQLKSENVIAVNGVSYSFLYGKLYAIMGHSGSGKSTLIHCLGLLDKVDSGKIYINDKDISYFSEKQKNIMRNEKIGFVFQNYYLNNNMRAFENIMLPMIINKKYQHIDIKTKAKKLLKEMGLSDRVNHYPKELSGGEQQRVAIARALANNPDIILADEPTGNLDIENEIYVLEKLRNLADTGKCVIIVSHNMLVKKYADIVINMKNGKFVVKNHEI